MFEHKLVKLTFGPDAHALAIVVYKDGVEQGFINIRNPRDSLVKRPPSGVLPKEAYHDIPRVVGLYRELKALTETKLEEVTVEQIESEELLGMFKDNKPPTWDRNYDPYRDLNSANVITAVDGSQRINNGFFADASSLLTKPNS